MTGHPALSIAFLALGLSSCTTPVPETTESSAPPEVAWMFDGHIVDDLPAFDIYLEIDSTHHPVVDNAETEYRELEPTEWQAWGVPANSLTACTSWWAGSGDVVYVTRKGRQLSVYRALLEERTKAGPFRKIKTITY